MFSAVPSNQLIVLKDVDAQSTVLHNRNGNIIIMTTNHIDFLDPACIRPGRMDVHLELGYCTHYQLNKMFNLVFDSGLSENVLKTINENLLPCEVMTLLSLYHKDQDQLIKLLLISLMN
ncbi:18924_t:CDS:2 [Rhizophagus irregularis]|nr:18924_t:CDS:2 [Rhizophagus irregularis]